MNKPLIFCLLLALGAAAAYALRPYGKGAEAKVSWMTVSSLKTGQEYYMEVAADGAVATRTAAKDAVVTKRGKIAVQLAKDFFREIENSEVIATQGSSSGKTVFYRGDVLNISAYISGELRIINSPLNKFGEAFSYAFNEVRKAAAKLPDEHALKGFLTAELLEGDQLQQFQLKAAKDQELKIVETYDIQKVAPLLKAIKQPLRMIPLETEDEMRDIQDFINLRQLYGLRKLFYLPSTRGTFKCQILDADKAAVKYQGPDKPKAKTAPAPKKARSWTPPAKN
ncbi:MAG: hypothetical protein HY796_02225 [Elusimicrobia bacterium]|nr:hypothetical protein [Elusimicrobiota bacterium]